MSLILASGSAIRAKLLRAAGIAFTVQKPDVDEDAVKGAMAGASPFQIAGALAERKALAVSNTSSDWVIGADQTLDLDGALLDKADSLEAARERLKALRGRNHRLHSAVVVARDGVAIWRDLVSPALTMRPFTDAFLDSYLARNTDAALSSVGAYQLEGEGVQLFSRIDGDYFAILGLPLIGLLDYLRLQGALQP